MLLRGMIVNNTQSRDEYQRRTHKVQDYIENNFDSDLLLETLSEVACFSKFHFHRIFKAITGESVLQYVNRIKLERAAFWIANRQEITITDIAYNFGYTDSSVFSRAFKSHFGLTPTEYRNKKEVAIKDSDVFTHFDGAKKGENLNFTTTIHANNIYIKSIDELRVIYLRYAGTYQELPSVFSGMMKKLYNFSMQQNLLEPGKTKVLTAYHDNIEITDETQLRTSLCLSVPNDAIVKEYDGIGIMSMSGKYAVGHFELFLHEYGAAWDYMYSQWLPDSGCQPRDAFPFEVYVSDPNSNPAGKQLLDIYLPIEPLGKL